MDVNELWGKAYELGSLIAESPEVEEYKKTKEAMESRPEIVPLLNKLRDTQSEYEKLQSAGQGPHLKGLEDSISDTLAKLDEFPEVAAFKQSCAKVDELLQSVSTYLANCITGKVNGLPVPKPFTGG